jgi:hypothetical protein
MNAALQNRVVAHFLDGHLLKGVANDFLPNKDHFHLTLIDSPPGTRPSEVKIAELKALYFVKEYGGNPQYRDRQEFDAVKPTPGRKIRVVFKDGELLLGTTQGYQPGRPGFFVIPADHHSNIERCFVVTAATSEVTFV